MTANTFTEAVQLQTTIMLKIAKRLDEKGYAVMVHGLNRDGKNERYLYTYFSGATPRFLYNWAAHKWGAGPLNKRRKPVIVHIHPSMASWELVAKTGNVTGNPLAFSCSIPNRKHFKPIHASLDLMCKKYDRRTRSWGGNGVLEAEVGSDVIHYRGKDKDELELLLRVLDMPPHREILTGGRKLLP